MRKALVMVVAISLAMSTSAVTLAHAAFPLKGAPQTISGSGDEVPGFSPIDEPVIVTLTHEGLSNFIARPIGRDGKSGMTWVNEIGNFSGTTFQDVDTVLSPFGKRNPIVAAEVKASGNWTIQIRKLSAAPKKNLKSGSGSGAQVIRFNRKPSGLARVTLTHDGSSNFIVRPIDAKGKVGSSLANEIGAYRGTVRMPAGTAYLWIKADGAWSYATR